MRNKVKKWWLTLTAAALTFAMLTAFHGPRHHRYDSQKYRQDHYWNRGYYQDYRSDYRVPNYPQYRYDNRYPDRYDYRYDDRYDRRDFRDRRYQEYGPRPW